MVHPFIPYFFHSCQVYQFGIDDLDYLATRCAPAMPAFWRSFALCQVRQQMW